ncbi:MAG: translation initiation factor IF-2, partial [Dehalococcoidia bacterium]|nr:translation initiation factor IF-2 [Dehalococcoidia bacterium]
TAMRARGAQVTDITVLVVAADDGVMPQTLEAIAHAKAAGVPIIVAINKMDKASANPDVVKKQLAEAELLVEDWGGDTISVPVSAKTKQGIETLLENILLVAEMENLRADAAGSAKGVVIEARMDKSKGAMATVLVHDGTLRTGDMIVAGATSGKVKAMYNDVGKQLRKAGPATPVSILGLHSVPQVGDTVLVATSERHARTLEEEYRKEVSQLAKPVSLSNIFDKINAGQAKELPVVLKVDVQGSIEPIKVSLERLSTPDIKVNIVHVASGNINENDVNLAIASKGIVIAFNTSVESNVQRLADAEKVDLRRYQIIYEMIDDVERAIKGLREPEFHEVVDGHANVKEVFTGAKKTQIAGLFVMDGKIRRDSRVRVSRADKVLADTTVSSLRRFKENVRDVAAGYECGLSLNSFNGFQTGDILEFYHKEKVDD